LQGGGIWVHSGTVTITSSSIYGNTADFVRAHVQKFPSPQWETQITFCSLFAGRRCLCLFRHSGHLLVHHQWEPSYCCARSRSKVPIAPMGDSRFARCLQGGGVYDGDGTVSIVNSQIYSNTANNVRAHLQKFPSPQWETQIHVLLDVCRQLALCALIFKSSHRPDGKAPMGDLLTRLPRLSLAQLRPMLWSTTECACRRDMNFSHRPDGKMADMPKSTLIFQFGSIFGSIRDMYVPATPANFPSPSWETHNCLLSAGRRFLRLFRHGLDIVFLDHRQHSFWKCACLCGKLPTAPMGKLLTCLPRLTLAQLRTLRSTSVGACHRDLESSHRPHGRLTFCSLFARCLQGGGVYVSSGTVTISSCTISGNTADFVRARS
jgi:hypothetical protein